MIYSIAQFCGLLGTVITVLQPQFRTKVRLSLCSGLINLFNGLNFALLGQTGSAMLLCLVAVIQSGFSIAHEKFSLPLFPGESIVFGFGYLSVGLLGLATDSTPFSILSLLPSLGAMMLMLSIYTRSTQKTRLFLLLNSLCWLVYTAVLGSTVFFSCLFSMASSLLALWKYRRHQKTPPQMLAPDRKTLK